MVLTVKYVNWNATISTKSRSNEDFKYQKEDAEDAFATPGYSKRLKG